MQNNYIYQYIDPIKMTPFYIGRGINGRIHDRNHNQECMAKVEKLEKAGFSFIDNIAVKINEGLNHDQAQLKEATLISVIGLNSLTNRREELSANKYAVAMGLADKPINISSVIERIALMAEGEDSSTSDKAGSLLWSMINYTGGSILNPCGGMGALLNKKAGTVIEIDNEKAGLAMASNNQLTVINADYLEWIAPNQYDLIIMNPPFKVGSKMILKAVSELKEGGTLAFIMQSTWRGYKGRQHIIYPELAKLGAFKSIYSLDGRAESKKYFPVGGGGIDLVVFIKGEEAGEVWVRNNKAEEFTYDQNEFMLNAPFCPPDIYRQLFDDQDGIASIPGYGQRNNKRENITFIPFNMQQETTISISEGKRILLERPKTCIDSRIMNKGATSYDMIGTELINRFAHALPIVKKERRDDFDKLMIYSGISTSAHTGNGADLKYPPFKKDWFEEESLNQW